MFTYRNRRTKQEVTFPERNKRLDGLDQVWDLVDENAPEPQQQPTQPNPDPEQPQPGTDPMPVPDEPEKAPEGDETIERFGRPAEDATVADLKGFAEEHGIDLAGATKKADIEGLIEEALHAAETIAASMGVEVEGRKFSAVCADLDAADGSED